MEEFVKVLLLIIASGIMAISGNIDDFNEFKEFSVETEIETINTLVAERVADVENGVITVEEATEEITSEADDENIALEEYYDSLELLAQVVYCEARGEERNGDNAVEGMRRVASVILNRVKSDKFPDTIEEVVSQSGQFACYPYCLTVEPNEYCYEAVMLEIEEGQIDVRSLYFSRGQVAGTTYNYTYLNHIFSY